MSTPDRPKHVFCALRQLTDHPPSGPSKTWCGRAHPPVSGGEWVFLDVDAALLENGRGLLCSECSAAIKAALWAASYRPRRKKSEELPG